MSGGFVLRHLPYGAASQADGVKNLSIQADAFSLPVKERSVDHVVSRNVLSHHSFPMWRPNPLTFRTALEKLEAELHRVTRKGATVTFHEHYTPWVLDYKEGGEGEEARLSRLEHLKQVFEPRWRIRPGKISKKFQNHVASGIVIKLFKK